MECSNIVSMRRVGGKRKGSEWWNEEVGREVAEKRRAFEEWLQGRDRVTYDRYRAQRVVVKRAAKVAKRMADLRWGQRLGNDFQGNKKIFWKKVKHVMNGGQAKDAISRALGTGTECGRCQGRKYQCSWQLADASVGRFE